MAAAVAAERKFRVVALDGFLQMGQRSLRVRLRGMVSEMFRLVAESHENF